MDIKYLIEKKKKSLDRYNDAKIKSSINMEIKVLEEFEKDYDDALNMIEDLKKELIKTNEIRAMAETILLIHGLPEFEILNYYRYGLNALLEKLEQQTKENTVRVPFTLLHNGE